MAVVPALSFGHAEIAAFLRAYKVLTVSRSRCGRIFFMPFYAVKACGWSCKQAVFT